MLPKRRNPSQRTCSSEARGLAARALSGDLAAYLAAYLAMKTPFKSSVAEMYVLPPALPRHAYALNW